MTNSIRLNLFKLHDSKDNANNWIFAKGKYLRIELEKLIDKTNIPKTQLVKHLMKKLDISISSGERLVYLKKEWYPLIFIEELVNITKSSWFHIQDNIEFLKSSKPPVVEYKAVKELSINICKIAGAHAADGTLHDSYIAVTDYHKSSIIALIKWFKEFDYSPKLMQIGNNEHGIRFHSRIISRYLTKFFDFPSGSKQYVVKEPEIIKSARLEYRKAFALGALTFEAGIGIKNQIELCVVSKAFRDSLSDILKELNIEHKSPIIQNSKYWRLWSKSLTKEEAAIWQELFEPNTEKWLKLNDYINGFSKKVNSFEETIRIMNLVYPRQSANKVILKDVILALKTLKQTHRYELTDYLKKKNNLKSYGGKWSHSIAPYLAILIRANIISSEKGRFGKKVSFGTIVRNIYKFNDNIQDWRVPERLLSNYYEIPLNLLD